MKEAERIVNHFFEIGTSRRVLRSHGQVLKEADDSLADHSFRTIFIGMVLAELEGADKYRVVMMCSGHDSPELRTGDANHVHAVYRPDRKLEEKRAAQDQWFGIPGGEEMLAILAEYEEQKTKEAIVAKDADRLDQILLQREYLPGRSYDLQKWHYHIARELKTESAKKLAELIFETNPLAWLYEFSREQKAKKKE